MPSIKPIECPQCHKKGWPGNPFETGGLGPSEKLHCKCGQVIPLTSPRDYNILSTHTLLRLEEASNHVERGTVKLLPGQSVEVKFKHPFDFPCKAYLTPDANILLKEYSLGCDEMTILSSFFTTGVDTNHPATVYWTVYGLIDIDSLSTWYVLFYSAITDYMNGLFKASLLNYAASFEAFVEEFLNKILTQKYGKVAADFLLNKMSRIEERCKELLYLAIGHKLSEDNEIYQPWDKNVRDPRNRLMHGERVPVKPNDADKAHQATYQAIRWIENLSP